MIRDIAELLQNFSQVETEKLKKIGIKHAPTIGSMYEGLTADILTRSLPTELELQIVKGFVVDGHGKRSGQIDCMLVKGEGERVPYTDSYEWHVRDVIVVLEVKKRLFGNDLSDAYDQLRGVAEIYSSWLQETALQSKEQGNNPKFNIDVSARIYAEVTGLHPPQLNSGDSDKSRFSTAEHLIFHSIFFDQLCPIRIIIGYEGYASEAGLREGFVKYLEKNTNTLGFGPPSLPQLIIAGNSSLIKLSGHPYRAPLVDKEWPIMGSSRENPILHILELIWTRLSYDHSINNWFGEDLFLENIAPLLLAEPQEISTVSGTWGWKYNFIAIKKEELEQSPKAIDWQPVTLNNAQFEIVNILCYGGIVDISDSSFVNLALHQDGSVDDFIGSLVSTSLVARNENRLELTTHRCVCIALPDGRCIAADDNTGRLTRWLEKFMNEWKKAQ